MKRERAAEGVGGRTRTAGRLRQSTGSPIPMNEASHLYGVRPRQDTTVLPSLRRWACRERIAMAYSFSTFSSFPFLLLICYFAVFGRKSAELGARRHQVLAYHESCLAVHTRDQPSQLSDYQETIPFLSSPSSQPLSRSQRSIFFPFLSILLSFLSCSLFCRQAIATSATSSSARPSNVSDEGAA